MTPTDREVAAALEWATLIEQGDATWNPYIVALAAVVREQREYIAGLEQAVQLPTEGERPDWREVVIALQALRERDAEVRQMLAELDPAPFVNAGELVLDGVAYTVIRKTLVRDAIRAISDARGLGLRE
jgi:hypothetical protein